MLSVIDDLIHQAVLLRLFSGQEMVALAVTADGLIVLAGVLGEDLIQTALDGDDLLGMDLDVRGLPLGSAGGLTSHLIYCMVS